MSYGNKVMMEDAAEREAIQKEHLPVTRPGNQAIIECIAAHFGVSYGTAVDWVMEVADEVGGLP